MRFAFWAVVAIIVLVQGGAKADWAAEIDRAFAVPETPGANLSAFTKWQDALARNRAADEQAAVVCGDEPANSSCVLRRQREARLDALRGLSRLEQLAAVQADVNRVRWIEDRRNYGVADYWAAPDEFHARGGDCEDFAFAKYDALKRLGFAEDQLRILVLWDRKVREPHAVLLAMVDGRLWMLDNKLSSVTPAELARAYEPIYSINAQGWWQHRPALREVDSAGRRR